MKLGIFGDSFAAGDVFAKGISWTKLLAEKLNCNYDAIALGGTSLYWSYANFIKKYKKYTHIVFVYTDFMRLNIMPTHLARYSNLIDTEHNLSLIDKLDISDIDKIELINIIKSRKYLDNRDFNKFVYQTIFDSVNEICRNQNIQLVNIHPFERPDLGNISFDKKAGTSLLNLQEISGREISNTPASWLQTAKVKHPSFVRIIEETDVRPNHLNPINNEVLANIILNSFGNLSDPINLTTDSNFCYDVDLVLELIEKYKK